MSSNSTLNSESIPPLTPLSTDDASQPLLTASSSIDIDIESEDKYTVYQSIFNKNESGSESRPSQTIKQRVTDFINSLKAKKEKFSIREMIWKIAKFLKELKIKIRRLYREKFYFKKYDHEIFDRKV